MLLAAWVAVAIVGGGQLAALVLRGATFGQSLCGLGLAGQLPFDVSYLPSMRDRWRYLDGHPPACTCADCIERRRSERARQVPLGIKSTVVDRLRWRYRLGRSKFSRWNRGFWRGIRWLAVRLVTLAVLVTVVLTAYHWNKGASFEPALRMMFDDYRLVAACPAEWERIRDFVDRPPLTDGPTAMAARHGSDWTERVCSGELTFAHGDDGASTPRPATSP